jgi:hypothetical protein
MSQFISKGSTKGLDTSCVQELHRPPFVVPASEGSQAEAVAPNFWGGTAKPQYHFSVETCLSQIQSNGRKASGDVLSPTRSHSRFGED